MVIATNGMQVLQMVGDNHRGVVGNADNRR